MHGKLFSQFEKKFLFEKLLSNWENHRYVIAIKTSISHYNISRKNHVRSTILYHGAVHFCTFEIIFHKKISNGYTHFLSKVIFIIFE